MLLLETQWIEPVLIISSMLSIMMMLPEGSLCTIEDIWSIINDNDGNEDGYNGGGGGNKDCIDDDDDDDDDD